MTMPKFTTRMQRKVERKAKRQMRREANKNPYTYQTYKTPLSYEQRQKRKQLVLGGVLVMGIWAITVTVLSVVIF